ncbi:hypothetical protein [Labilibaculum filiforme]|uniref:hypothetical protein n=1 Tax=Labilibaculum filiforme TaxID=1940526 RepID=UPI000C6EED8B|nr:hypothetical protein [Labilibaculum filiforme]
MKNLVLLLFIYFNIFNISAQNQSINDTQITKKILYGQITLDAFKLDICSTWYPTKPDSYLADTKIVKELRTQKLETISISLIIGSWCHDSHREVPRFIKILEEIQFPFDKLKMNALDTHKIFSRFRCKR